MSNFGAPDLSDISKQIPSRLSNLNNEFEETKTCENLNLALTNRDQNSAMMSNFPEE